MSEKTKKTKKTKETKEKRVSKVNEIVQDMEETYLVNSEYTKQQVISSCDRLAAKLEKQIDTEKRKKWKTQTKINELKQKIEELKQ